MRQRYCSNRRSFLCGCIVQLLNHYLWFDSHYHQGCLRTRVYIKSSRTMKRKRIALTAAGKATAAGRVDMSLYPTPAWLYSWSSFGATVPCSLAWSIMKISHFAAARHTQSLTRTSVSSPNEGYLALLDFMPIITIMSYLHLLIPFWSKLVGGKMWNSSLRTNALHNLNFSRFDTHDAILGVYNLLRKAQLLGYHNPQSQRRKGDSKNNSSIIHVWLRCLI